MQRLLAINADGVLMTKLLVAIFFLTQWQLSYASSIDYEIYKLIEGGQGSKLIAKGKREYSIRNVEVHPYQRDGRPIAEKLIELEQGYRVGARIFYEKELTGFGLLAKRSDSDFSWEWYNKHTAERFRKLQGGTFVTVRVLRRPMVEELMEVKFIQDTPLRFIADRRGLNDTHVIIVKAGSVLKFD